MAYLDMPRLQRITLDHGFCGLRLRHPNVSSACERGWSERDGTGPARVGNQGRSSARAAADSRTAVVLFGGALCHHAGRGAEREQECDDESGMHVLAELRIGAELFE